MMRACPVCESTSTQDVISIEGVPVLINAQVAPDDALDVPRGDIDLVVCCDCAHVYNQAYRAELLDYDTSYENSLHYSPRFQQFAERLAVRLVRAYVPPDGIVMELGSGPGHFLAMLCRAGAARGLGFDPSFDPDRLGSPEHLAVTLSKDPFPTDGLQQADLALSQHVLEHLDDPKPALEAMRGAVQNAHGVVYIEVPNGQLILEHCAIWDVIYEHFSYFVPSSLETVCRRSGLTVRSLGTEFDEQFLWCDAAPDAPVADALPGRQAVADAIEVAEAFGLMARRRISEANDDLDRLVAEGPVVLWGSGSKGMTYLNLIGDSSAVSAVVDVNPRKVGCGVPGTRHVISAPDVLMGVRPTVVLAANPTYIDEITESLNAMQVDARVQALWT